MASRNKKGKVYGIFKTEFHISFFHKPSMEETDIYYYMVLDETIFLKMRLLYDIVLVIEEMYPLTSSYMVPEYEKMFKLLKDQTAVTVVISLIGNTIAFRQTCVAHDAPVIDEERFVGYPQVFYNKYKNYCGNEPSMYGFFLIALKDETFTIIENSSELVQEELDDEEPIEIVQPVITQQVIPKEVVEELKPEVHMCKNMQVLVDALKGMLANKTITTNIGHTSQSQIYTIDIDQTSLQCYCDTDNSPIHIIKIGGTSGFIEIHTILVALMDFSKSSGISIYILNVSTSSRLFNYLSSEWSRVINGISVSKDPRWDYTLPSFCTK